MAVATSLVGDGPNHVAGSNIRAATIGAVIWTLIHLSTAAMLFALTLATFEHCLGRVATYSHPGRRRPAKKAFANRSGELDAWFDDDPVALTESPRS